MTNHIKKAFRRISLIFKDIKNLTMGGWSPMYIFWNLVWWISWGLQVGKLNKKADKKKQYYIEKHIEKHYPNIINKYRVCEESNIECKDFKIWVFWGQGERNMPHLVKACYNKLKQNNRDVQFIDMNNVSEFVQLPQTVYDKLHKGELLFAHFSDILRNTLLAKYGGLWIDSTVWFPNKMPEIVKECVFFSPHNNKGNTKWCSYAIGSNKIGSVTFSFIRDILTEVCINEKIWPDYLLQDRIFIYATKKIPAVKKSVNNTPDNNLERFMLFALMNKPYDEKYYKKLISENFIFKLSYKAEYKLECDGKSTYYAKVINEQ